MGLDALAITAQSLVGFFIGADRRDLARRVAAVCSLWAVVLGFLLSTFMWAGQTWLAGLLVPVAAWSVFFPAWLWGPFGWPGARFIGASYEQSLATRDNRKTRLLIESDWYQRLWPTALTSDQNGTPGPSSSQLWNRLESSRACSARERPPIYKQR